MSKKPHIRTSSAAAQDAGPAETIIEYGLSGSYAGGLISITNDDGQLVVNLFEHTTEPVANEKPVQIQVHGVPVPTTVVSVHRASGDPLWDVVTPQGRVGAGNGVVADVLWEAISQNHGAMVTYSNEDSISARLARQAALRLPVKTDVPAVRSAGEWAQALNKAGTLHRDLVTYISHYSTSEGLRYRWENDDNVALTSERQGWTVYYVAATGRWDVSTTAGTSSNDVLTVYPAPIDMEESIRLVQQATEDDMIAEGALTLDEPMGTSGNTDTLPVGTYVELRGVGRTGIVRPPHPRRQEDGTTMPGVNEPGKVTVQWDGNPPNHTARMSISRLLVLAHPDGTDDE